MPFRHPEISLLRVSKSREHISLETPIERQNVFRKNLVVKAETLKQVQSDREKNSETSACLRRGKECGIIRKRQMLKQVQHDKIEALKQS